MSKPSDHELMIAALTYAAGLFRHSAGSPDYGKSMADHAAMYTALAEKVQAGVTDDMVERAAIMHAWHIYQRVTPVRIGDTETPESWWSDFEDKDTQRAQARFALCAALLVCMGCGKPVLSSCIEEHGVRWHPECYGKSDGPYCTFCKKNHPGGDTCLGHHP